MKEGRKEGGRGRERERERNVVEMRRAGLAVAIEVEKSIPLKCSAMKRLQGHTCTNSRIA